jgi:hypothetical protein
MQTMHLAAALQQNAPIMLVVLAHMFCLLHLAIWIAPLLAHALTVMQTMVFAAS